MFKMVGTEDSKKHNPSFKTIAVNKRIGREFQNEDQQPLSE